MSNSLFCCAAPRNVTGGVLEWVNRTTIHPFCDLAIDIPESRSLTNGVRHQAPRACLRNPVVTPCVGLPARRNTMYSQAVDKHVDYCT